MHKIIINQCHTQHSLCYYNVFLIWLTASLQFYLFGSCHNNSSYKFHYQAWRLWENPNTLWTKVLKAIYFPNSSYLSCESPRNISHIWKAIQHGKQYLIQGMRWVIGSCNNIQIWEDKWLPNGTLSAQVEGPLPITEFSRNIDPLYHHGKWHLEGLPIPIPHDLEEFIRGLPTAKVSSQLDQLMWPTIVGKCIVKEATRYLY